MNQDKFSINFVEILKRGEFRNEPSPHWVSENALPLSFLQKLEYNFPNSRALYEIQKEDTKSQQNFTQNTAYRLQFQDLESQNEMLQIFAKQWVLQKDEILDYICGFLAENQKSQIAKFKAQSFSRGDYRATSPVTIEGTTQLGPHLDSSFEIFAGLIYLRMHGDYSSGGDLQMYKLKSDAPDKYMSKKRRVPLKYLNKVSNYPYLNNFGVFFISHPKAIHGISPRSITQYDRRLINLTIELPVNGTLKMFDETHYIDENLSANQYSNIFSRIMGKYFTKNRSMGKYSWIKFDEL